jgi:TetR/AcrR family transcriptional regulator of autoinduction and epiphytic fitness
MDGHRKRSLATRTRITEAAYALFCARGYAATTLEEVATRADVALQTVKVVFHGKADLLLATVEHVAAGSDQRPVAEQSWFKEAVTTSDGHLALALVVEHGTEIYRRLAPLMPAIQTAATVDERVAAERKRTVEQRRRGLERVVASLHKHGRLRGDLDVRRGTDVLFVLQSPECFHAFTGGCGWSEASWKEWQLETVCTRLLEHTNASARARAHNRSRAWDGPSRR